MFVWGHSMGSIVTIGAVQTARHRWRGAITTSNSLEVFRRGPNRRVIALWYGPDVEWVGNVLAAGGCRVRTRGRWIKLADPRRFHDPSRREIPWFLRPVAALLRVEHFLELRRADVSV